MGFHHPILGRYIGVYTGLECPILAAIWGTKHAIAKLAPNIADWLVSYGMNPILGLDPKWVSSLG